MVPGGGFDVEEAKMASEELRLESEIRSLEMLGEAQWYPFPFFFLLDGFRV